MPDTTDEEERREARGHIIDLEQCSIFVDSRPLKRSMVDAAKFLRKVYKMEEDK